MRLKVGDYLLCKITIGAAGCVSLTEVIKYEIYSARDMET